MLTPKIDISSTPPSSHRIIPVLCDCGRERLIEARKYFSGQATCGKCTYKAKEFWLKQSWGSLRLIDDPSLPSEWSPLTHIRFKFSCECGNIYEAPFGRLSIGRAVTCGKCNNLPISVLLGMEWNHFRLSKKQKFPNSLSLKSNKLFDFVCSCGRIRKISLWDVSTGNSKSCGHCKDKSFSYWLKVKWGDLRLDENQKFPAEEISSGSQQPFNFVCACGRTCVRTLQRVHRKGEKSCGKCSWLPKEHWLKQQWGRLHLDPNQDLPDEWAPWLTKKFWFICQCSPDKEVRKKIAFGYPASGGLLSCGCVKMGISDFSPATEIFKYVQTLTSSEVLFNDRKTLGGKELDIFVPDYNLAIEYHGLIWHSEKFRKGNPDSIKFQLCQNKGIRLLQVYQDEWRDKQPIIKVFLQDLIAPLPKKRAYPVYSVEYKTPREARSFLDQHHYLGAASGCLTILAKYQDKIIGVWVFQKREEGTVLWHRACWDRAYKAWNPHQKALEMAKPLLKQMGFQRILTFSDNRFHTGKMYEETGFTFEGKVKPNYYYTDGENRLTKYTLRVPAKTNEKAAAAAKGWFPIWDSGKKRFSLQL